MTPRERAERVCIAHGEAKFGEDYEHSVPHVCRWCDAVEAAIVAAVKAEREACAKEAESMAGLSAGVAPRIAAAIRARSTKGTPP